jgi:hypothetical protein
MAHLIRLQVTDIRELEDSYHDFIALPLEAGESNKIYIRGRVDDVSRPARSKVVLSAVSNELIPWPQAINAAKPLGVIELNHVPPSEGTVDDSEGVNGGAWLKLLSH